MKFKYLIHFLWIFILIEVLALGINSLVKVRHYNYDFILQYQRPTEIFDQEREDGQYLYSQLFPTTYYSSIDDERGKKILKIKDKTVFRVFVFGGSSVAGSPFGHWASFPLFLDEELERLKVHPGVTVEVVNFGVSSIGTSRVLTLIQETMEYRPDLVIVYSGHNEIWDGIELVEAKERKKHESELGRLKAYLVDHFQVLRFMAYGWQKFMSVKEEVTLDSIFQDDKEGGVLRLQKIPREQRLHFLTKVYERNMQKIVRVVRKSKAKIVLMSQISNEMMAPSLNESLSRTEVNNLEDELVDLLKNNKDTLELSRKLLSLDAKNALAIYAKGVDALKNGDYLVGEKYFQQAIEWDPYPERFKSSYRKVLENLHDPKKGVYFIDTFNYVKSKLPDRVLDGRLLIDLMHPNITGYKFIAQSIMDLYFLVHEKDNPLFNLLKYEPHKLWKQNIEAQRYALICERYFPHYLGPGWGNCIELLEAEFWRANDVAEKRAALRMWEFYYYHGLSGNKESSRKALQFFPGQPNRS